MKVGDLVTLSQYGQNLGSVHYRYKSYSGRKDPLIGLIIEKRNVGEEWHHLSTNESVQYHIRWMTDGPGGRDYYTKYFYRKDLKFVR